MGTTVISVKSDAGLDAQVDPRFGRCAYFLVVGEDGAVVETVDNQFKEAQGGAGTGAAGLVNDKGASKVVSGRFGPNAFEALEAMGVAMYLVKGEVTAREALAALGNGALEKAALQRF